MRPCWLLIALLTASCFDEFGPFDPDGGSGGTGAGTAGAGQGAMGQGAMGEGGNGLHHIVGGAGGFGVGGGQLDACPLCADVPDTGSWLGPIILRPTDEPCAAPYPDDALSGSLLAGEGNPCGCQCSLTTQRDCRATVSLFGAADCSGVASSETLIGPSPEGCEDIASTTPAASRATAEPVGGACTASAASQVAFEALASCAAPAEGECLEDDICVRPPKVGTTICIHAEGLFSCGDSLFNQRRVLYQDTPSNTGCSAVADCSCGVATGGTCSGSVTLNSNACVSANPIDTVPTNASCDVAPGGAVVSLSYPGAASGGGCDFATTTNISDFGAITTLCCTDSL